MLRHCVNQQRRIAVGQAVEDSGDVEEHGASEANHSHPIVTRSGIRGPSVYRVPMAASTTRLSVRLATATARRRPAARLAKLEECIVLLNSLH